MNDDHFGCARHAETSARARGAYRSLDWYERKDEGVRVRNGHFDRATVVIRLRRLRSYGGAAHGRGAFRARRLTGNTTGGDHHFRVVDAHRCDALDISLYAGQIRRPRCARSGIGRLTAGNGLVPVAVISPYRRVPGTLFGSIVDVMIGKNSVTKSAYPKKQAHKQNEDERVFDKRSSSLRAHSGAAFPRNRERKLHHDATRMVAVLLMASGVGIPG